MMTEYGNIYRMSERKMESLKNEWKNNGIIKERMKE